MNEKADFNYSKFFRRLSIGVALAGLLLFNYCRMQEYLSAGSGLISHYQGMDDDMNKNRNPAVAGLFYPAAGSPLNKMVEGFLEQKTPKLNMRPKILIVPHAGYKYSAMVAASAYKELLPYQKDIRRVILVGPAHRVAVEGAALSSAASFSTPLGIVKTDEEEINRLAAKSGFVINDAAHKDEHSLEVQLPFLQKVLPKFKLIPVVYGRINSQNLADVLAPYLKQKNSLIIFSADMSHYLDYDSAKRIDGYTAELVENMQPDIKNHMSCGAAGLNAALLLARRYGLAPKLLEAANSGDVTGEKDSVVGYASWIFANSDVQAEPELSAIEKEVKNLQAFAKDYGAALMAVAQKSLQDAAAGRHYEPKKGDFPDALFEQGASFVTLKKNAKLRGCIGTLVPRLSILKDVAQNTYKAAREDSRFSPVQGEEAEKITISISLLTDFEPIVFSSEKELLDKIISHQDGLVLQDGRRQGVFLPSVWEELKDKKEFLNNLKIKAGLSPNYWSDNLKVYRFRVVEIKQNAD